MHRNICDVCENNVTHVCIMIPRNDFMEKLDVWGIHFALAENVPVAYQSA